MLHDRHRREPGSEHWARPGAPARGTAQQDLSHFGVVMTPRRLAAARPAHSTWEGCINDRDQSYDTQNTAPGISGGTRPRSSMPNSGRLPSGHDDAAELSVAALKDQIDAMTPSGNTNQAVGLAWGWQSLSTTNAPIAAPAKDSTYVYKDYDRPAVRRSEYSKPLDHLHRHRPRPTIHARQTSRPTKPRPRHGLHDSSQHQQRRSEIAGAAVLRHRPDNFQMITCADQTADAFKNILTQISKLRVSK